MSQEIISKHDAAFEVYNALRKLIIVSLGGLASIFAILVIPRPVVYVVAIFPCSFAIYFFMKATKRMNYLNENYKLGFKKIEMPKKV